MPLFHQRHRRLARRWAVRTLAAAAACGTLLSGTTATAGAADLAPPACHDVRVPVTLDDSTPAQLSGRLCAPAGAQTVAVLIPGITYTRAYFDFPYQPETYSFARAANRAGYATFVFDKLGTGDSTRPASTKVTVPNNVATVHQIVQALRTGTLGQKFGRVVAVGHSYGSIIAYAEAGRHRDVDAVVTTGISHRINLLTTLGQVFLPGRPAALDPKFAGRILDPGYLTTSPGERPVFYDQRTADAAVIAADEKLKDTFSLSDFLTYLPDYLASASRGYDGPVLVVNGQADQIMCGIPPLGGDCSSGSALAADERGFYSPGASVDGIVVPDTAHDLALSTTAPSTTAQILRWLAAHTPAAG
jgi:pimeloyl-ACP methyl ester carboxylesterase